jgi:lysophospholipase L1-like esterase
MTLFIIIGSLVLFLLLFVARAIVVLKKQVRDYRDFWLAQNQLTAPKEALLYVALGDSAAQGVGATRPENGYVWLFAKYVEEQTGRPVHVVNLSVSGAKIRDLIDGQLPQLAALPKKADIITVDIGANNMRGFEPHQFESEFKEMLQQLPKGTLVADIPYFGPDFHRHGGKQAKQANKLLERLWPRYSAVKAGLYAVTQGNDALSYYGTDLFHPSDKSYRLWAKAFQKVYKK